MSSGGQTRSGRAECNVALVLGALGFTGTTAIAPGVSAAELVWHGPSTCENRVYVAEQAEALSRRSLESVEEFAFEVSVEGRDDSWEVVLITHVISRGERRVRRLRGKSCGEVSDAAAVAIAMTLGGQDEPAPPPESGEPPQDVTPSPTVPPVERAKPALRAESPSSTSGPKTTVGIHAVLDTGALPSVAIGADLSLGLEWEHARVALESGFLLPNSTELSEGQGGTFELVYGALLACVERSLGTVVGSGCLGYEIGSMSGEGTGPDVDEPHLGSALWHGPRLELGARVPLSAAVRWDIHVGAVVPLSRPPFVLDEVEVVHRASPVTARARMGVEVAF